MATSEETGIKLMDIGALILRYGLVVILLWMGALKFTTYEAEGIKPLLENSPLVSWAYGLLGLKGLSGAIGIIEIILGLLIATRSSLPRLSAIGSLGAVIMFIITLSFTLTTPGVWQPGYGFPYLSSAIGQLLAKDIILLGAAVWTAGEAYLATTH